ncbi:MAG: type II toxin-antitoxin system RelE/ParE family toxin [Bacteroidetes bacterium]|nr:type II toxin-antitoxin system RelE/ParE family toxin [Bacteroidota bacterium]
MYEITASPVFKLCLQRLVHFLSIKFSPKLALETKQLIKSSIVENLSDNPFIAPISDRLVSLGIKEYRQYLIDQHNIVFYRVDEENRRVILLAVIDSRQSIQKLLSEVILLS